MFEDLPVIIGVLGVLLAIVAAAVAERLASRRRRAERLVAVARDAVAEENRRLYAEQRSISLTLQHALLPDDLVEISGLEVRALDVVGERGVDIGGDWYDVIKCSDTSTMFVIGDVSGLVVRAADDDGVAALRRTGLRHAGRRTGGDPRQALQAAQYGRHPVRHRARRVASTSRRPKGRHREQGSLPPLLVCDEPAAFVEVPAGIPVGVDESVTYCSTTSAMPSAGTMVLYTDGLVERRGESVDVGLDRLRQAADACRGTDLEAMMRVSSHTSRPGCTTTPLSSPCAGEGPYGPLTTSARAAPARARTSAEVSGPVRRGDAEVAREVVRQRGEMSEPSATRSSASSRFRSPAR